MHFSALFVAALATFAFLQIDAAKSRPKKLPQSVVDNKSSQITEESATLYVIANVQLLLGAIARLTAPAKYLSDIPFNRAIREYDAEICGEYIYLWKVNPGILTVVIKVEDYLVVQKAFSALDSSNTAYLFAALCGFKGYPINAEAKKVFYRFKNVLETIIKECLVSIMNLKGLVHIKKWADTTDFELDVDNSPIRKYLLIENEEAVIKRLDRDCTLLPLIQNAYKQTTALKTNYEFLFGDLGLVRALSEGVKCLLSQTTEKISKELCQNLVPASLNYNGVLSTQLLSDESKQSIRLSWKKDLLA